MRKNFLYLKWTMVLSVFLTCNLLIAQTPSEQQKITSRYDVPALNRLEATLTAQALAKKEQAASFAQQQNLEQRITLPNGAVAELQYIADDGSPIYYQTLNVNAAISTRANFLNSGGGLGINVDGQNMIAYVWDGGHARVSHQEYDGAGGTNRVTIEDTASEGGTQLHYHAAHVTGTISASGVQANAKGMAPHSQVRGYMWNNDVAEATAAAASGMLLSNHSYGFRSDLVPDQYFGAYIQDSRDWDNVMYNAPYYLMVVAAGNDGNTNYNGAPLDGNSAYDKLTGHSTSKNNMVVANAQDANIDGSGNLVSVVINSSSSEGPTDDYRIKPDITGNGTSLTSTYESSNTAYGTITGTSMASPNVMGSLLLLQQHANNTFGSFMRASTLKGLALHTADDAGPTGPDAVYGWGLMNSKRAAEAISDEGVNSVMEELTLTPGQTYTVNVDSDGVNSLVASLSWTDPAGTTTTQTNSNTPKLVNDLDIRVTKGGTTYFPYRLTGVTTNGLGDNIVDPYERIAVGSASGTYTISVTHKGSLSGGSQNYSLIVTGIVAGGATCTVSVPANVNVSGVGSNSAIIGYNAVTGATYDVRYRATGGSWTTVSSGGTSTTLNGLTASTAYEAQVRSKCPDGTTSSYSSSVNFTTTAVQLNYCASQGNNVSDEYIGRVQLESIDNTSGSGNGYSDFTNISTNLAKNGNVTITVTPVWTGTVYAEGYSVWIDYNQDGDFTDAGEQVWTQAATTATPVSGSFTVPNSSADGNTRMRVSMKYNAIPTECETFTYGEVEDYTVNITGVAQDTQAPSTPLNLTASNTTDTTTDLSWNASTDNVGVTGYEVFSGGSSIGTVTGTTASVTGLTAGTSYTFNVRAFDAAGNNSALSNTVNVTTTGGGGGGCTGGITSFPYAESFESGLGAWTQSTADDINWTRDSGGTPSSNTGPSGGSPGSWYMYVEASGNGTGYPNKQAILNSPCFNLAAEATASFDFNYHMYGASDMGSIALEASDDDGATWTSLWSQTGNKGNAWLSASVDLAAYVGGSVQLRFNRITGSTWQADIAIDNAQVNNSGGGNSGCAGGVSLPYAESFESSIGAWTQSTADDINWTRDANGTPSSNTGPSGGSPGSWYMYVEASGNGTGYPNKRAILNSPCLDLSAASGASFNFNYHMYGATDMGTIDLEVSDDDGASWVSVWSQSGNQGNAWLSAGVDISAYVGGGVQLRFNRVTGSTWQADIAIDNISAVVTSNAQSTPFGTQAINGVTSINLYPNPVKAGVLYIEVLGTTPKDYVLFNFIGQVVGKGAFTERLDVSQLQSGVYIIQVNTEGDRFIERFIKE